MHSSHHAVSAGGAPPPTWDSCLCCSPWKSVALFCTKPFGEFKPLHTARHPHETWGARGALQRAHRPDIQGMDLQLRLQSAQYSLNKERDTEALVRTGTGRDPQGSFERRGGGGGVGLGGGWEGGVQPLPPSGAEFVEVPKALKKFF